MYWVFTVRWWLKRQNFVEEVNERLNAKYTDEEEEKDKEIDAPLSD